MYKKVNNKLSEINLEVLSLFTKGFNKEYYIREVQKLLKISPRTAQLALEYLEKKAVLESRIRGKIKTYRLKNNLLTKDYLNITEIYKKIKFLEKNIMVKDIVEKILPYIEGHALIFGSYAKGIQKEDSDLDIFVIGSYNQKKIKAISNIYNIKINIKSYPLKIFKEEIKRDILIKEVLDNHIIIKDAEKIIGIIQDE